MVVRFRIHLFKCSLDVYLFRFNLVTIYMYFNLDLI
jgi:hypothetical protein